MTDQRVTAETAVVYRGGGRRWFTRRAAYRAEAKALIREHCWCSPIEPYTGCEEICRYHDDPYHFEELVDLLAYLYEHEDSLRQDPFLVAGGKC
jgi:hypothetical protein